MKKSLLTIIVAFCVSLGAWSQVALPDLHVDGKWLVDDNNNHVVLHGVMDTPSMYFNGNRWGGGYNDYGATNCLAYFEKLFAGLENAYCDVFRLHLDPAWTNDDGITAAGFSKTTDKDGNVLTVDPLGNVVGGEADISHFSADRLRHFMEKLYLPLMKKAMNHGMYVVVRPPGVCPTNLKVGDYYQDYLLTVWDIVSSDETIKQYAGQISLELANEPVNLRNANNQDDDKALKDYFQPIVNKIRENGFTGVVWIPGTGWQSNYRSYINYPIEGTNIGYAVHDYTGWYGCSDNTPDPQDKINTFHWMVPVVDNYPIIITEVDWSPYKPGTGHYNEHGEWVLSNYGTWSTGSTSKWGVAFKTMLDHFGNISMTLSGTGCLIDIDELVTLNHVAPAFLGLDEACGKACLGWYAEYKTGVNPLVPAPEETDREADTDIFALSKATGYDAETGVLANGGGWNFDEPVNINDWDYILIATTNTASDDSHEIIITDANGKTVRGEQYLGAVAQTGNKMWLDRWNNQNIIRISVDYLREMKYLDTEHIKSLTISAWGGTPIALSCVCLTDYENTKVNGGYAEGDVVREYSTSDHFGTICLPYKAICAGAEVYSIAGGSSSGISLTKVEGLMEAGKPYIYLATDVNGMNNEKGVVNVNFFRADLEQFDVSTPLEDNGLVGTFTQMTVPQGDNFFVLNGNKLYYTTGASVSLGANKAYVNSANIQNVATGRTLISYDAVNGVRSVISTPADHDKIYDLQGREVGKPGRGIFVSNGRKVVRL